MKYYIKRTDKKTKVGILYNEISRKINEEHGVVTYGKNMAMFAGIGFATSLAAFSQMPNNHAAFVALSIMLTASSAIVGMVKSIADERKQVNSLMQECIKDIATREDLIPVEKVVLERYLTKEKLKINEIVKDNIISTNMDLNEMSNMSSEKMKFNLVRENSIFSKEDIADNLRPKTEYMRDTINLNKRMGKITFLQEGLEKNPKIVTRSVRIRN